jgi:hypothetical protein
MVTCCLPNESAYRFQKKLNAYRMPAKAHLAGFAKPVIAQKIFECHEICTELSLTWFYSSSLNRL